MSSITWPPLALLDANDYSCHCCMHACMFACLQVNVLYSCTNMQRASVLSCFGVKYVRLAREHSCYFQPRFCAQAHTHTHILPLHTLQEARYANYEASEKDSVALLVDHFHPYQIEFFILNCNALASGPWSPGTNAGREPNPEAGF